MISYCVKSIIQNVLMFLCFFLCFKAVLRQFGGGGYGGSDNVITDEEELHRHQKLEKLYISTRSAKVLLQIFSCLNYTSLLLLFY